MSCSTSQAGLLGGHEALPIWWAPHLLHPRGDPGVISIGLRWIHQRIRGGGLRVGIVHAGLRQLLLGIGAREPLAVQIGEAGAQVLHEPRVKLRGVLDVRDVEE